MNYESEIIQTPLGPMLRRKAAGEYLKAKYGFGSPGTLAKAAGDGSGPVFHKFSPTDSLYPISGLDEWAMAKLGEPRRTFTRVTEAA